MTDLPEGEWGFAYMIKLPMKGKRSMPLEGGYLIMCPGITLQAENQKGDHRNRQGCFLHHG